MDQHVTTHPSVVTAFVCYFEKKGIPVTVGDNPAGKTDLIKRAKKAGIYQAAKGHFKDISDGEDVDVASTYFSTLVVSKNVLDAGYIVNVPKFKTHLQTLITGAVKNIFGMLPGEEKSMIHCKARSLRDFSRVWWIYAVSDPLI